VRVTLKQLLAFDTVARHGSINKAAEELSLSQSAVSLTLKDLEAAIGFPMFERRKRTLVMNENGRRFQPRARAVLRQVADLEGVMLGPKLTGSLRVAAGSTAGTYVLPRICARFSRQHPEVNLKLVVCSSSEVVERVDAMKQDIGIIEGESHRTSLKRLSWFEDALTVFCAPGHRLAGRSVAPGELEQEAWFIQPLGSFTRYAMSSAFRRGMRELRVTMEMNSPECIKKAVMEGGGLGCLSRIAIQDDVAQGRLAMVQVPSIQPLLSRTMGIVLRKDVYHGELIEAFVQTVLQDRRGQPGVALQEDRRSHSAEVEKLLQEL